MKNLIKNIILSSSLFVLASCAVQSGAAGRWENSVKDASGASVTTTLTISEAGDSFTGNMSASVSGNSDTANSSLKNIDFSGYSSGNILVITNVNKSTDPYFTQSTLTVSEDKTKIVLAPSGLVFTKK